MIKRVVCVDSRSYQAIKEGKIYDVTNKSENGFFILFHNGQESWYEKECFREIEYEDNEKYEEESGEEWEKHDECEELETRISELKSTLGIKNLQYNELSYKYEQFKKDIIMKLCEDESRLDIIKFIMER